MCGIDRGRQKVGMGPVSDHQIGRLPLAAPACLPSMTCFVGHQTDLSLFHCHKQTVHMLMGGNGKPAARRVGVVQGVRLFRVGVRVKRVQKCK